MIRFSSKLTESESRGISQGICILASFDHIEVEVNLGEAIFVILSIFNGYLLEFWRQRTSIWNHIKDSLVAGFLDSSQASLGKYQIWIPCAHTHCRSTCVQKEGNWQCYTEWRPPEHQPELLFQEQHCCLWLSSVCEWYGLASAQWAELRGSGARVLKHFLLWASPALKDLCFLSHADRHMNPNTFLTSGIFVTCYVLYFLYFVICILDERFIE